MIRVLLFGRLSDIAGWRERPIEAPPRTLSELRAMLSAEDERLGEALAAKGVQAAIDKVIVRTDVALAAGMEVAFLPPMSGG